MRNLLTAFVALSVSCFTAGMAAVMLAQYTRAKDEFIVVFMSILPLGLIVGLPMLVASYLRQPGPAVTRVARWLFMIFALLLASLFAYAFYVAQSRTGIVGNLPVLAAIAMPAAIILVLQWLIFRWRARPPAEPAPMQFGRIGGAR